MWKRRIRRNPSNVLPKLFLILFIFSVIGLIILLLKTNLLTVKKIEIDKPCVEESLIKNTANLLEQNYFLIDSTKIIKNLKKRFLCIENIKISKSFPDKVKLEIIKREAASQFINQKEKIASSSMQITEIATPSANYNDEILLVDKEGVVFAKSANYLNVPEIFLYGLKISLGDKLKDGMLNYLKILDKFKTFGVLIEKSWTDGKELVILTPEKSKIVFHLEENIDIQLASLQLILSEAKIDLKEVELIDLRFDKPVIKIAPKNNGKR